MTRKGRDPGETTSPEKLVREYRYVVDYDPQSDRHKARCVELGDVVAEGMSDIEAIRNTQEAALRRLKGLTELPTPLCRRSYGGKVLLRLTPEKHREVAEEADRLGVSMNDYITSKLK